MEEEIQRRDEKMISVEKDFTLRFNEMRDKFEKAQYDSLMFQGLFQETKCELVGLTQVEYRNEHFEALKT